MYKIERITYSGNTRSAELMYDPLQVDELPLHAGQLTLELNQSGSFAFQILPGHPLYNQMYPMETYISVLDNDEEIFYGRVISVDDPVLNGQITVQCEGALSFLNDGEIAPFPKNSSGDQSEDLSGEAFFRSCIDRFNQEINNDPRRKLTVGTISFSKKANVDTYSVTSYTNLWNIIDSMILSKLGGYVRIREGANHIHLIDWVDIENYGYTDEQPVRYNTSDGKIDDTWLQGISDEAAQQETQDAIDANGQYF